MGYDRIARDGHDGTSRSNDTPEVIGDHGYDHQAHTSQSQRSRAGHQGRGRNQQHHRHRDLAKKTSRENLSGANRLPTDSNRGFEINSENIPRGPKSMTHSYNDRSRSLDRGSADKRHGKDQYRSNKRDRRSQPGGGSGGGSTENVGPGHNGHGDYDSDSRSQHGGGQQNERSGGNRPRNRSKDRKNNDQRGTNRNRRDNDDNYDDRSKDGPGASRHNSKNRFTNERFKRRGNANGRKEPEREIGNEDLIRLSSSSKPNSGNNNNNNNIRQGPRSNKRPFTEDTSINGAVASLPVAPVGPASSSHSGNYKHHYNKRRKRHDGHRDYQPTGGSGLKGIQGREYHDDRPQFRPARGEAKVSEYNAEAQYDSAAPPAPQSAVVPYQPVTMRSSTIYERVLQVGEGTYGKVYKSRNVDTGVTAALKRLRMESEREGMPITAVREIRLLQSLRHQNIVSLREMMIEEGNIYMVFEYMDHDLAGILSYPELKLSHGHVKYLFKQMMEGLAYLHHKGILHRDIKGSNILLNNQGLVKIADFGLARTIDLSNPNAHYTNRVITLWYRPPELLLGATVYSTAIDVWGLGCLLIEMFRRQALFPGQDEISQLASIYNILGTPSRQAWPEAHSLPWYQILYTGETKPNVFRHKIGPLNLSENCLDLAEKLLILNPKHRISARDALTHRYFTEDPRPESLHLESIGEWHDFEAKKRRRKDREEKRRLQQKEEERRNHEIQQQQQQKELIQSSGGSLTKSI